jgi:mRNA interferase YafQ
MLEVRATTRFKKEVKKAARQQEEMQRLGTAIDLLQAEELLPERNLDHALTGNYMGHRECHLSPDWLLIYKVEGSTLILVRTGSHSELFR